MIAPTVDDIRVLYPTSLDLGALGLEVADPDPLATHIAVANAVLPGLIGYTFAALPPEKEPLARLAIAYLALRSAIDMSPDRIEILADFDLLTSFGVGGYNESRRSVDDAIKAQAAGLTGWPGLDWLLRQLMSPEKLEELEAKATGVQPPAFAVTEPDWGGWG